MSNFIKCCKRIFLRVEKMRLFKSELTQIWVPLGLTDSWSVRTVICVRYKSIYSQTTPLRLTNHLIDFFGTQLKLFFITKQTLVSDQFSKIWYLKENKSRSSLPQKHFTGNCLNIFWTEGEKKRTV